MDLKCMSLTQTHICLNLFAGASCYFFSVFQEFVLITASSFLDKVMEHFFQKRRNLVVLNACLLISDRVAPTARELLVVIMISFFF